MKVYCLLSGALALSVVCCKEAVAQEIFYKQNLEVSHAADHLQSIPSDRENNSILAQSSTDPPEDQSSTELETVEESAEVLSLPASLTKDILQQPLYTPFRREGTVGESSRPAYVVTREQIEAQGSRTVQEALRYLPGLISDGTAGGQLGALSGQFLRGAASSQVLILLDGRPINDIGFFGGFDLSEITTNAVERIEVIPGGGSTLYGSDAIGGLINIISRDPGVEPELNVSLEAGSFDLNQQEIELRGRSQRLGWVMGYNRIQATNDFPFTIDDIGLSTTRDNAEVTYNNANLKLDLDITDRQRLTFNSLYLAKDFGVAGGVPIPGSLGEFNTLTPLARQVTQNWLSDLTYQVQLGADAQSQLTARLYVDVLNYEFNNPDPSTFGTLDDINRTALGAQLQHDWPLASNQTLTYGVDYRTVTAENTTFDFAAETLTTNYDGDISQGALFAQYWVDFSPALSFNLGLRQDTSSLVNGSVTSPSAGIRWNLTDSTVLRANYARSFRAPLIVNLEGLGAFNVVGNPNLKPERGDSFDIGLDQQLGTRGLLQLTYYLNDIDDLIAFEFGDPSTYTNIGRVRAEGLEAALNFQIAENWYLFANYSLNDPRIEEAQDTTQVGNELGFIGAESLNLGLAYENPQGLYIGLLLHQIGERFVDNANTEMLPSYTTVDLKLRIPVYDQWILNASVDNLFDQQYQEFPGFPGVGTNVRVGLGSTF